MTMTSNLDRRHEAIVLADEVRRLGDDAFRAVVVGGHVYNSHSALMRALSSFGPADVEDTIRQLSAMRSIACEKQLRDEELQAEEEARQRLRLEPDPMEDVNRQRREEAEAANRFRNSNEGRLERIIELLEGLQRG